MKVSRDSSCAYHCCDQYGHSLCEPFADHYERMRGVLRAILACGSDPIPPDLYTQALRVMAE